MFLVFFVFTLLLLPLLEVYVITATAGKVLLIATAIIVTDPATVALIREYIKTTDLSSYNIALKVIVYKRTVERIRSCLNLFSECYKPLCSPLG